MGWKGKIIAYIFYIFLFRFFPKPDITFYLMCPLEESIRRKTDIKNVSQIDALKNDKKILDDLYRGKKNVIEIDTGVNDKVVVLRTIIDKLKENKII